MRKFDFLLVRRLFITSLALLGLALGGACASKRRKAFLETPLQDMFDHKVLAQIGINGKELPERFYDESLAIFVRQFVEDAKKRGITINEEQLSRLRVMRYVDTLSMGNSPGVMAACNRYSAYRMALNGKVKVKWMTIEVLKDDLEQYIGADPKKQSILMKEVLYHELVHCLLDKGHLPPGIEGIMSPYFIKGDERSFEGWELLLDEMFSQKYMDLMPNAPSS